MDIANRTRRLRTWTAAVAGALLAVVALAEPGAAQDPASDAARIGEGARLYGQTCARCHNLRSPTERSDREWRTIMLHMRTRANLSKSDADAILAFLTATNVAEGDGASDEPVAGTTDAEGRSLAGGPGWEPAPGWEPEEWNVVLRYLESLSSH